MAFKACLHLYCLIAHCSLLSALCSLLSAQNFYRIAEDEAEITGVNLNVPVPFGNYTNCIKTHNFTELEQSLNEDKFYAPGVGFIKEVNLNDNSEIVLISIL